MFMPVEKDTVAVAFAREAIGCLIALGHDPIPVLSRCGIDRALLNDDTQRIAAHTFSRLWIQVAALADDEFFNLDTRRLKVGTYAALCHGAVMAQTLGEAMKQCVRMINILLEDRDIDLTAPDAETAELQIHTRSGLSRPFADETLLVLIHGLACWLVDRRIPILQAQFAYPRPSRWEEYELMFTNHLAFDAPFTAIRFHSDHLRVAIRRNHANANYFLRGAPHNIVVKYRNDRGIGVQLRRLLRESVPDQWPTFSDAASRLGMPPHQLNRRLKREGTGFQLIKNEIRREIAEGLLQSTEMSLEDISQHTGFTDVRAFRRAFRQWGGTTPGAFRKTIKRAKKT